MIPTLSLSAHSKHYTVEIDRPPQDVGSFTLGCKISGVISYDPKGSRFKGFEIRLIGYTSFCYNMEQMGSGFNMTISQPIKHTFLQTPSQFISPDETGKFSFEIQTSRDFNCKCNKTVNGEYDALTLPSLSVDELPMEPTQPCVCYEVEVVGVLKTKWLKQTEM
jgi:hypothetical protein